MDNNTFEVQMRAHEQFHKLRVPDTHYAVLRVDGNNFSKLTARYYEKPFDEKFYNRMTEVACELLNHFHGIYVYTESDEISLLLPLETTQYNRGVEKLVSISAGIASAVFTRMTGIQAFFDSRVITLPTIEDVEDYFSWRKHDSVRNALNAYAYWTQIQSGVSVATATRNLLGKGIEYKKELLRTLGVDFDTVENWEKHGIGIYWTSVQRTGFNPITQQEVSVNRTEQYINRDLPEGDAYRSFIRSIIE